MCNDIPSGTNKYIMLLVNIHNAPSLFSTLLAIFFILFNNDNKLTTKSRKLYIKITVHLLMLLTAMVTSNVNCRECSIIKIRR